MPFVPAEAVPVDAAPVINPPGPAPLSLSLRAFWRFFHLKSIRARTNRKATPATLPMTLPATVPGGVGLPPEPEDPEPAPSDEGKVAEGDGSDPAVESPPPLPSPSKMPTKPLSSLLVDAACTDDDASVAADATVDEAIVLVI